MTHLTEKDLTPSLDAKIEVQGSDNHPCGNDFKINLLRYVVSRLEIHGDKELANLLRNEFLTKEKNVHL
jgi:hypothetical protein